MNSADILGRCASTTTLSTLRASTFGLVFGSGNGAKSSGWCECASGVRHRG